MENKTSFHKFMDATNAIKVELALLDEAKTKITEAKQQIASLKSANKAMQDLFQNAEKFSDKLNDEYGFANSLTVVIQNAIGRTEKAAKDLGIDINAISEIKELKSLLQQLDREIVNADSTRQLYNG
jgi:chromosome segregation ATPase